MTLSLADMPSAAPATDAAAAPPTSVRPGSQRASRRMLLRGVTLGAVTIGAAVASLSDRLTSPALARPRADEVGPGGIVGHLSCPADWGGTQPEPDEPDQTAACTGNKVGAKYCDKNGWHKTDAGRAPDGTPVRYWPVQYMCVNKNAWRWKVGDAWYRCSDGWYQVANSTTDPFGEFTLCQARL
ncbi:hypothetical protein GCM10010123_38450 [Pilimelia anulata]|uniref:Uncharacterized protein n=1 Tax=Pilimelia anulata TaxID=53371 RepID=A0A8J3FC92_9ACTN|nr:hypothetical protein [Pilimelia anulata]GGK04792.1 hypothetical protein GCM10010123_38450 [Pilimelia anulata]